MDRKIDLRNLNFDELSRWVVGLGLQPYRSEQVFRWLFDPGIQSFNQMSNLSKKWQTQFEELAYLSCLVTEKIEQSSDGTRKFLFRLEDGEHIESVLIPERGHHTLLPIVQEGGKTF